MARIKLELPVHLPFSTTIPVRITDLNYGNHVGNDTVLSIIHEARMQWLRHLGYTEMQFAGTSMIMSDAAIEYKSELVYGDIIVASVGAASLSKVGFDVYYKLVKQSGSTQVPVAFARTGMICYDYEKKKITALPEEAKRSLVQ